MYSIGGFGFSFLNAVQDGRSIFSIASTTREIDQLPDDAGPGDDLLDALREHDTRPPYISTNGVRSTLKRLCEASDIDVNGMKEYITPHAAVASGSSCIETLASRLASGRCDTRTPAPRAKCALVSERANSRM
ncbi:hypothetical protein [Haloarcula sp. 1CSR25-25]|uniref:hypothetical protein n=1 Tax=Haloarcula sp. 1CSR25-25 TaxID=2862545 RepID=UPI0028940181|nr:hypothetical protein [Haloarcula sp. 1CSR25-25]MDT3435738.1 hypothetical protein [Haloarcula sp. 1CSR25-25]